MTINPRNAYLLGIALQSEDKENYNQQGCCFDEKASYDFSDISDFARTSNWQVLDFEESEPLQENDGVNKSPQNSPSLVGRRTRSLRKIYDEM